MPQFGSDILPSLRKQLALIDSNLKMYEAKGLQSSKPYISLSKQRKEVADRIAQTESPANNIALPKETVIEDRPRINRTTGEADTTPTITGQEMAQAAAAPPTKQPGQVTKKASQPATQPTTPGDKGFVGPVQPAQRVPDNIVDVALSPKPPAGQDPINGLMGKLTDMLSNPAGPLNNPRPLSTGELMSIGIIAALNPDFFAQVVHPMLAEEQQSGRQKALDQQAQQDRQIRLVESMASLLGVQEQRREGIREFTLNQERMLAQEGEQKREFGIGNERRANEFAQMLQLQKQRLAALGEKVPALETANYVAVLNGLDSMKTVKQLMAENTDWLTGGTPGGPLSSKFKVGPGAEVRASLDAAFGTINDTILKYYQRRGIPANEALKIVGGALPTIDMSGPSLRQSTARAERTLLNIQHGLEGLYPGLTKAQVAPGGVANVPQHPGFEHGDVDLGSILDEEDAWSYPTGVGEAMNGI